MKLPVSELLRLACIYAEADRTEFLACNRHDPEQFAKTREFLAQLRAYRLKRWGKTRLEQAIEEMTPTPIERLKPTET